MDEKPTHVQSRMKRQRRQVDLLNASTHVRQYLFSSHYVPHPETVGAAVRDLRIQRLKLNLQLINSDLLLSKKKFYKSRNVLTTRFFQDGLEKEDWKWHGKRSEEVL